MLGPAALHRGAAVDHDLRTRDGASDSNWIAEVTDRVRDSMFAMRGRRALERADRETIGAQARDDRRTEPARRAGDEVRHRALFRCAI